METRSNLIDRIAREAVAQYGMNEALNQIERVFHLLSMDEIDTLRTQVKYHGIHSI
jgi:hypothetical protein